MEIFLAEYVTKKMEAMKGRVSAAQKLDKTYICNELDLFENEMLGDMRNKAEQLRS